MRRVTGPADRRVDWCVSLSMRPVPAISVVAEAILCGALTGACAAPSPATHAAHHDRTSEPATLPAATLAATDRRALTDHDRRLATLSGATLEGEAYVVYEGEAPKAPPTSPALLWLALAVPAGVGYRLVIAMIEGRQAHIVLLACASLFLSGLVLVGA